MQITFEGTTLTIQRETNDRRYTSESHLLYAIKTQLNRLGLGLIKKLAYKDGHMLADTQHYLRSRKTQDPAAFMVWDDHYAVRDLAKDFWNKGKVNLRVERLH